jgi:hypothetical protein
MDFMMSSAIRMMHGASVMAKSKALCDLGLHVIAIAHHPAERIDFCLIDAPTFPMYATAWGDVWLPAEFDTFLRDFRTPYHPEGQVLFRACKSLVSDLYGCASTDAIDGALKQKGWKCYAQSGGGVRVCMESPLDLHADIYGRLVTSASEPAISESAFNRRRFAARLSDLIADVNSIHKMHEAGVAGDIRQYVALERQALEDC